MIRSISLATRPFLGRPLSFRPFAEMPALARQALASVPVLACALALICAGRALPF
jgi:hypothetical protein